jgi:hypothetical protein
MGEWANGRMGESVYDVVEATAFLLYEVVDPLSVSPRLRF